MTVFTSSYTGNLADIITSFVKLVNPIDAVDFGTQQGNSAILIGKGMQEGSYLFTIDRFDPQYDREPYGDTHANLEIANQNILNAKLDCTWGIVKGDALEFAESIEYVDLAHIDICNHKENVEPLLRELVDKVGQMILLEGGITNQWMTEYGFEPYSSLLDEDWIAENWTYATIRADNNHNALTIMVRK